MRATASEIVQYSIPNHIRTSNPDFVKFLQYYYAFTEQENQPLDFLQNMVEYKDIDTASELFAEMTMRQYLKEFPASVNVDKRLLTKHIRDFFEAKGSFPSYEFLINSLFGESIEREWMTDHVLRASANEWLQDVYVIVLPSAGDFTKCIGSKITQVSPIAIGYVTGISSDVVNGESVFVLKLDHRKITNKFVPHSTIRILKNDVENRNSTDDNDYYVGTVKPGQSNITIDSVGSLYSTGQKIRFIGGSGEHSSAVIAETLAGTVDSVDIEIPGSGYSVGDQIYVENDNVFSAEVTNIDGYGATVSPVMEVNSAIIKDGGYGYTVGDIVEARSLVKKPNEAALKLQVATVQSVWSLDKVRIDSTGKGYTYSKIVLFNDTTQTVVANFAAAGIIGQTTVTAIKNFTTVFANGISDVNITTNTPVLANNNYSLHVNGFGCDLGTTLSSGVITNIPINFGGWNYQDPVVKIIGDGSGASASLTKDVNGTITNIGIISGGSGYTNALVTVEERLGSGAILTPIIHNQDLGIGKVTSLTILDRGEFTEELNSYNIEFQSVTGSGKALVADLNYRVKNVVINTAGEKYINGRINTTRNFREAVLQPIIVGGVITAVNVLDPGYEHPSDTTVTYYSSGAGSDAVLSPVISEGRIISVTVIDGGTDYVEQTNLLQTEESFSLLSENNDTIFYNTLDDNLIINTGTETLYHLRFGESGAVINSIVTYGGSGLYTEAEQVPTKVKIISDTGYGAVIKPVIENGKIIKCIVLSVGSGYSNLDTVEITGAGSGAIASVNTLSGKVVDIQISNPGQDYIYGTAAYIYGSGHSADLSLNIETGITSVDIINGGSGYTSDQTFSVTDPTGANAVIRIEVENGSLSKAHIIAAGSGYTSPSITVPSGSVIVKADRYLKSVGIVDSGINYYEPQVFIQADSDNPPTIECEVQTYESGLASVTVENTGSGYTKLPSLSVIDNSNYGSISSIRVNNFGADFVNLPQLLINSTGSGAKVIANSNSIGRCKSVRFTNIGVNYEEISKISFPTNLIIANTNTQFKVGEKIQKQNGIYLSEQEVSNGLDMEDGFSLLSENNEFIKTEQEFRSRSDIGYIHSFDWSRSYLRLDDTYDEYPYITEDGRRLFTEDGFSFVDEDHESIVPGDILIGTTSGSSSLVKSVYKASGHTEHSGTNYVNERFNSDIGKLNTNSIRIHNNERFQDFAYVLRCPLTFVEYEQYIKNTVHPAGYKAFTDVDLASLVDIVGPSLPDTGEETDTGSIYITIYAENAVYPFLGYEFIERNSFHYRTTPMSLWKNYKISDLMRRDLDCDVRDRLMIGRQELSCTISTQWVDYEWIDYNFVSNDGLEI